jgi:hypothetical protein
VKAGVTGFAGYPTSRSVSTPNLAENLRFTYGIPAPQPPST